VTQKKAQAEGQGTGVDLGTLDVTTAAEEGAWLVPMHPATGELLDCRLLVHGEDSKAYGKAMNRIADMRADRQRTRRRTETNYDDIQAAELILSVYLTSKWENFEEEGSPIKCDADTKRRVFNKHRWLAEQVVAFARDRGNFIAN
jgi:hypothetical protein